MGKSDVYKKFWEGTSLGYLGVDGKIIWKWILEK